MADDTFVTYAIDGKEEFPGTIGKTEFDSTTAWPVPPKAPNGAPNVLFYVLDDVGFGQLEPFGGLIKTPALDRIAKRAAIYTNVHTTGLCSPTRTCIITGRNHHTNAMGSISEWSTGYPGYNGRMTKQHGFLSEILREQGYNTFALGKWHLSVSTTETPAGPFDTWPLGRGFDRYYGFLPGETDQWYPDLTVDNHSTHAPGSPEHGYHLSKDLADQAIKMVAGAHNIAPDKPFFLYFCPGAGHAPHHIFTEEADKYNGVFDMGWDKYREVVFTNQKKLGFFDENAEISPPDPDVPAWDSLSADAQKLYTRMMEVMAGYVTYTDRHFGRVSGLPRIDRRARQHAHHVHLGQRRQPRRRRGRQPQRVRLLQLPRRGPREQSCAYRPARDTRVVQPLRMGMGARRQHAVPAVEEGDLPRRHDRPVHDLVARQVRPQGRCSASVRTRDRHGPNGPRTARHRPARHDQGHQAGAVPRRQPCRHDHRFRRTPRTHTVQYFEMFGCRSIYQDGWRAECGYPGPDYATGKERGRNLGDPIHPQDLDALEGEWQLFNLNEDPAEAHDLAEKYPDKLKEMIALWWQEAEKYDVLPLQGDDGFANQHASPDAWYLNDAIQVLSTVTRLLRSCSQRSTASRTPLRPT